MKLSFMALMIVIFELNIAQANTTYTTSTGAVFTQAQGPERFGTSWRDPSGTIWSAYQGDYTNQPIKPDDGELGVIVDSRAIEACTKAEGKLPKLADYERLLSYFERKTIVESTYFTAQGKKDFYAIFPDTLDDQQQPRWFWTSTVQLNNFAVSFDGQVGECTLEHGDSGRGSLGGVRCVVDEPYTPLSSK